MDFLWSTFGGCCFSMFFFPYFSLIPLSKNVAMKNRELKFILKGLEDYFLSKNQLFSRCVYIYIYICIYIWGMVSLEYGDVQLWSWTTISHGFRTFWVAGSDPTWLFQVMQLLLNCQLSPSSYLSDR